VTHMKCPDCGITLMDRSGVAQRRCPRCMLRSGAVVEMIRRTARPVPRAPQRSDGGDALTSTQ